MLLREEIDVGWSIIGENHISSDATRSKMKECIETLQELRRMQMYEINISLDLVEENDFSLTSMPEECVTLANEANVIVQCDNLQNLPLPSQSIIGGLDNIASQDISLTLLCSNFEKSAEHISSVYLMNVQEVKIFEKLRFLRLV